MHLVNSILTVPLGDLFEVLVDVHILCQRYFPVELLPTSQRWMHANDRISGEPLSNYPRFPRVTL